MTSSLSISCEFFPPKTDKGCHDLLAAAHRLSALKPDFFSVTYGAGGSQRDCTFKTVENLRSQLSVPVTPHLTGIGDKKYHVKNILDRYRSQDIHHLIALRGDFPEGEQQAGDFAFASDLVEFIRTETGHHFFIDVAAYPEFHPEALTPKQDLVNFKKKVDAGANRAITQYFFSFEAFSYFLEDCQKLNITIPIIPGIIPILNWPQLVQFSNLCGTDLPSWLLKRMRSFESNIQAMQEYGLELVTRLCEKLLTMGIPGFHFYTLNKADLTLKICKNLGLTSRDSNLSSSTFKSR